MTEYQNIRNKLIAVPTRQVVNKAGEISSTVEDTTAWPDENGLKIKDGKLALSTSTSTTVTNAQTLYPQLWANSPAGWKSGSDLVVPPQGGGIYTGWMNILSLMDQASGYPLNTGISDANQNYSYYYARVNGDSLDLRFRWNGVTAGSGTTAVVWPYPDLSTLGLPSSFTGLAGDISGVAQTYKIGHVIGNQFVSAPIGASLNGMTLSDMGSADGIRGADIEASSQVRASISIPMQVFGEQTPTIYLFDNVLSSSIGLPKADKDTAGLVTLDQVAEGNRNYIINGGDFINQRGADSASAINRYIADRWLVNTSGATVLGSVIDDGSNDELSNFLRLEATVADDNWGWFQRVESVKTLAGKKATLSFEIRSNDSSVSSIDLENTQVFGTGGSPSTAVLITPVSIDVTNDFVKHEVTFDIPSISGKTLGTDKNDYLAIGFIQKANQTGQFDIRKIKLEEGTQATKFTRAGGSYASELALCQRYFERLGRNLVYIASGSSTQSLNWQFSVEKRTTPSVSYTATAGSLSEFYVDTKCHILTGSPGGVSPSIRVGYSNAFADSEL